MEFDLASYILGIVATVIGSTTVALFALSIQFYSIQRRTKKALFSEIRHNFAIVQGLLGDKSSYLSSHWSYQRMPFQTASFDIAKQNGCLYNLKAETYERIAKAYDIMYLIQKENYGPTGSANNTFAKLGQFLKEIIEIDIM